MQLFSTDVDAGPNGAVSYSLLSPSSLFSLSSSGLLTTTQQGASTLDRETQDTYYLMVRGCDGGTPKRCTGKWRFDTFTFISLCHRNVRLYVCKSQNQPDVLWPLVA